MSGEIAYHVFSGTANADITTAAVEVWKYGKMSVEISSAGGTTHAGPIYLQVGNASGVWETKLTLVTVVAGSAIDVFADNIETSARYVRLWFDRSAGAVGETITFVLAARQAA